MGTGVWGTGGMEHMGNGAHKQWGIRGNGVQGVWSTRGMGQIYGQWVHVQWGKCITGVWGTGYGVHGQWDTWVMGTGTMGYRWYVVHGQWGAWTMEYIGIIMLDLDLDVKI